MGLTTDGGAGERLFLRDCKSRKAHAPARKSLRVPTSSGRRMSELDDEEVSRIFQPLKASARSGRFLPPMGGWRYSCLSARLGAAQDQPIHAAAYVPEIGFVPALQLGDDAAGIANLGEGLPHRFPVHVTIPEVHPLVSTFLAFEVFQVNLDDALPQRANPVLRIAVKQHIPNVEPSLDPRTLKFLDVRRHLKGAQQELVPNLFDGNYDLQLFSERNQLVDLPLRTRPGVAIRSLRINYGGNEQHRVRTP